MHCPLLSLPLALGTTLETLPRQVPYLRANPDLSAKWRDRLPAGQRRVGLVWSGKALPTPRRSLPFEMLAAALAPIENVTWVSLQKSSPVGSASADWLLSSRMEITG